MIFRPNLNHPRRRSFGGVSPLALTAIFSICLGASAAPASHARAIVPKIVVGTQDAQMPVDPYLGDNGTLYAPVEFVKLMGADFAVSRDGGSVQIMSGSRTSVWPCEMRKRHAMVAIASVAQDLGGVFLWDQASQTATVLARIRMVREDSDQLSISTSFPVGYHVNSIASPNRVFIDLPGASLGGPYTTIPVSGDDVAAVRANQMTADTVRVAVDLKRPLTYRAASIPGTNRLDVQLVGGPVATAKLHVASMPSIPSAAAPDTVQDGASSDGDANNDSSASPAPSMAAPLNPAGLNFDLKRAGSSQHIANIAYDTSTPGVLRVDVTVAGPGAQHATPYKAFILQNPSRLALDLPGADFDLSQELARNSTCTLPLMNSMVHNIRWGIVKSSSNLVGRVVLDLYKPLSYTVAATNLSDGGVKYTLNVLMGTAPVNSGQPQIAPLPDKTASANTGAGADVAGNTADAVAPQITEPDSGAIGGSLAGMTIVVDAGHGGHDTGAPGLHGVFEKNIVLAISKDVRDELVSSGARVIMTRSDDTFIPLLERSRIGNDNHANFFLCIHADSTDRTNGASGTTVYYHANASDCHSLARSIANRLAQLNDGIQSLGPRSDYVRYPGVGFSVLRHSNMPAVLVETGYVNSENDQPVLCDPADQKLIAQGIVAGVRDFMVRAQVAQGSLRAHRTRGGRGVLALTQK